MSFWGRQALLDAANLQDQDRQGHLAARFPKDARACEDPLTFLTLLFDADPSACALNIQALTEDWLVAGLQLLADVHKKEGHLFNVEEVLSVLLFPFAIIFYDL